jgi:hypothetical protein
MACPDQGYYLLIIAVLSSNVPLRPEVSMRLYQAAYRLHHRQENVELLQGDLVSGKVLRLSKDLALGSVTGPAFEAEISTPQGEGRIHFLLTRQGLELGDEAMAKGAHAESDSDVPMPKLPGAPRYVN